MLTILIIASVVALVLLGFTMACLRIGAIADARAEEMWRRELGSMPAVWCARQGDDEAA